ncbi:oxidoreductase [Rhodoblastus sphagnicola]|uniref:Oxidoreductase n=1 Tax=Rhodoblastus sphagnicola TaxID=333368 RepID=A0A2S6MU18_9HYPH|nr:nitrogenase component 1 [Rhodoblastus sphagnicola]MBB4199800.1 nitrogenase molybdenum-iron protein alpha/beta subunit [Rhodoblastus sphagnicola]PPQ25855.1 oxidoreductase [Rhodoblastus sphagnicola]
MARRPRLQTRETRLGALGARLGDAESVVADFAGDDLPQKRIRTFSEAAHDDLSAALDVLGLVEDLGLVVHGPRGCAVGPGAAQESATLARIAVTDLDQRDTVLGAGDALARTLKRLNDAVNPAALVVLGSPVVAINNDEIRAVVAEVATEIGKPVVWARTDGFRSHIAATGADAAADALLNIVDFQGEREPDLVNLLTSWTGPAIDDFAAAISTLGLRVNVLPAGAKVAALHRAARARASVVLDPDGLDALASGLSERFGVPVLDAPPPIGPKATALTLTRLADLTGRKIHAEASAAAVDFLRDKRIVLAGPSAFAFALADLAEAAGAEVVGLTLPHLDRTHSEPLARFSERRPKAQIHIGEAQGFELANVLQRLAPDLVVGAPDAVAAALRLGIPAARLDPADVIGVSGADAFAKAVSDAFAGAALARRLARSSARYSAGWLRRSPDWHVKLEVK